MKPTARENQIDRDFATVADKPQRIRSLRAPRRKTSGEDAGRRLRGRLGAALNALAAVAIVAALAGTSLDALAQTPTVVALLSNNLQTNSGNDPYLTTRLAQAFNTGPEFRHGYELESIQLRVTAAADSLDRDILVTVNEASGINPGSVLYTLDVTRSDFTTTAGNGLRTFEAPEEAKLE